MKLTEYSVLHNQGTKMQRWNRQGLQTINTQNFIIDFDGRYLVM